MKSTLKERSIAKIAQISESKYNGRFYGRDNYEPAFNEPKAHSNNPAFNN